MNGDDDIEIAGVGDIRMVRTFRVGAEGGLYPVNSSTAWTEGWNTATCARGRDHTPPDPGCRCGFYVYAHPSYALAQAPAAERINPDGRARSPPSSGSPASTRSY